MTDKSNEYLILENIYFVNELKILQTPVAFLE